MIFEALALVACTIYALIESIRAEWGGAVIEMITPSGFKRFGK
jgi:hypothetical protein